MKIVLTAIFLFFLVSPCRAETYKWRDAKGRLHFSDTPPITGVAHDKITVPPIWSPGQDQAGVVQVNSSQSHVVKTDQADRMLSPQRKIITAADYDIEPTILISGRDLSVRGRINRGPECANLTLKFYLKNENGHSVTATTMVANVGRPYGSTIYIASNKLSRTSYGQKWVIVERYVTCN